MTRILLDTGPLVAFLHAGDQHHAWARDAVQRLSPPLHTCEAVVAEACHLVRRLPRGREAVLELCSRGLVTVTFDLSVELTPVRALLEKWRDVPMDLADACLVRMAESTPGSTIFTLDADFRVYRTQRRHALKLLAPPGR